MFGFADVAFAWPQPEMRVALYPVSDPYDQGHLAVGEGHEIYYEQCGNPNGKPAVVLHGGPGGSGKPRNTRFFDPARYRIIMFDQRGCARSRPYASLVANTTWHLVADLERLRKHLGIDRWLVFGGSWGSTLGVAYAQTHPAAVSELILNGIFMIRQREIDWLYREGASEIFPDHWREFVSTIPPEERGDLIAAYARRLHGDKPDEKAAIIWSQWEARIVTLRPNAELVDEFADPIVAIPFARIESHYFLNRGFFESDGQLLDKVETIRHIPATIVQGRYDMVTPMRTAEDLRRAWPEAKFVVVDDAGHSAFEPGMAEALVAATDHYAE